MIRSNWKQGHRNKWISIESAKGSSAPPRPATRPIRLGTELARQLENEARTRAPREACGVLVGPDLREIGPTPCERIDAWIRIPNVAQQLDRFAFDPFSYAQAERSVRHRGHSIIGIYHSHPCAAPTPSPADEEAARRLWGQATSWLYLILGRERPSIENPAEFQLVAWRLVAGSWLRVPLDSSTAAFGSSFDE